jgi:hypothetical protein
MTIVVILFIVIAIAMQNKFLHHTDSVWDKAFYYIACVALTPLFGAILYKFLTESKTVDRKHHHHIGNTLS